MNCLYLGVQSLMKYPKKLILRVLSPVGPAACKLPLSIHFVSFPIRPRMKPLTQQYEVRAATEANLQHPARWKN